ncbi:MAG: hypothetical protein AB7K64_12285 [Variibacter sp.]
MTPELTGGLLGLIGGLISGALAALAAVYIHRSQNAALEKDEIRKRKVEVIFKLLGSRYVLSESYSASAQDVHSFNTAIALFTVYFSDNKEIMRRYDAFMQDKSNTDKLVELLREAAKEADLDLLDSSVRRVLTVKTQAPTFVIQTAPAGKK